MPKNWNSVSLSETRFYIQCEFGKVNAILDGMHKVMSPGTYDCDLCALTYGAFNEKKVWREFRENSSVNMEFLHKDEFEKRFASKWLPRYDYPIVLSAQLDNLELFISAEELKLLKTPEELINLVEERLPRY